MFLYRDVDSHDVLLTKEWEWRPPFYIACDHFIDLVLDLVVFWEDVGVSNPLHFIGHIKLVLQLQKGVVL